MKVVHVGGLNYKNGGPSLSMALTIKGLRQQGVDALGVSRPLDKDDKLVCDSSYCHFFNRPLFELFGWQYIPKVSRTFDEIVGIDLMHLQGIWSSHMHSAALYARQRGIPYLIAPRGSLYPHALAIEPWKKKLSLALYQDTDLKKASCIQATCKEEYELYRKLGYKNPVAILPNPIDCESYVAPTIEKTTKFRFGYIGRLHPRKRVERLIYAFAERRDVFDNCELLIIGADVKEYEEFLKEEVKRLNLQNVHFSGFLRGEEKDKALCSLSCMVNPSDFENFGNVVSEALMRGVPVIATKGSPWQGLLEYDCGWWIDNDQDTITKTMVEAYERLSREGSLMGENGKRMVRQEFSVTVLGEKMKALYDWILGNASIPEFVIF